MTQYNTVLIAIDLYGEPEQVLAKANALFHSTADVHVLSVAFDPTYFYTNYGGGNVTPGASISVADKARIHAKKELRELIAQSGFSHAKINVEFGRPQDIIIKKARELEADIIIIGSHGRHGLSLLLGSTANAVLHHAKCDVLAVRIQDNKN